MSQSLVRFVLVTAAILAVPFQQIFGENAREAMAKGNYYGYEAQYKVKVEFVRVRMRDGVELAARIARPDAEGRFPAIMAYYPYRRLTILKPAPSEREYNHFLHSRDYFAARGYAAIDFDVRGTGNSAGSSQDIYADDERRDAYEMVEWIAAQPWCSGKVGLWGMSYGGVVQWQVAKQQPPHLKAMLVGSANTDVYLDWTYPGGALRPYMFDTFSPLMTAYNFAPWILRWLVRNGLRSGGNTWRTTGPGASGTLPIRSTGPTGGTAPWTRTTTGSQFPRWSTAAGPMFIQPRGYRRSPRWRFPSGPSSVPGGTGGRRMPCLAPESTGGWNF